MTMCSIYKHCHVQTIHLHPSVHLCITTVYCAYTLIYFIHNCSYQTDQLCSYQKIEDKTGKMIKILHCKVLQRDATKQLVSCIESMQIGLP